MKKVLVLLLCVCPLVAKPIMQEPSAKEITCLAQNMYFEARNQGKNGLVAVGYVTLERVEDGRWPNKICDVVWQYKVKNGKKIPQFSWTQDGKSDNPKNIKVWNNVLSLAYSVYNGYYPNPVPRANHYHSTKVKPKWSFKMKKVAKIKDHIFYRG